MVCLLGKLKGLKIPSPFMLVPTPNQSVSVAEWDLWIYLGLPWLGKTAVVYCLAGRLLWITLCWPHDYKSWLSSLVHSAQSSPKPHQYWESFCLLSASLLLPSSRPGVSHLQLRITIVLVVTGGHQLTWQQCCGLKRKDWREWKCLALIPRMWR